MRLLRSNGAFRALFVSRTVSFVGDSLSLVVLMLYVADVTGTALAVALLLIVGDFAPSLFAPLAGAVSDRFPLRRVMITCDLVQACLVGLLALTLPALPVLLTVVGLRALAAQVFAPASRSAMPVLVDDHDLDAANATLGLGSNSSEVLGPVLAAVLFPVLGIQGVLAVDAITFLVSAVALRQLPSLPRSRLERPTFLGDARIGLQYVWAIRPVRIIVVGFCGVVLANGIDDVAVVFLVQGPLGGSPSAAALALGGAGAGLIVGFALLARAGGTLRMTIVFSSGLAINSAGNLLTGLAGAVAAAVLLQTIRGLGIAAGDVASTTLLQRIVPAEMTGRVFANLYGLVGICAGISYAGGGLLLAATSPRVTFVVGGALGVVIAAVTAWRLASAHTSGSTDP